MPELNALLLKLALRWLMLVKAVGATFDAGSERFREEKANDPGAVTDRRGLDG